MPIIEILVHHCQHNNLDAEDGKIENLEKMFGAVNMKAAKFDIDGSIHSEVKMFIQQFLDKGVCK